MASVMILLTSVLIICCKARASLIDLGAKLTVVSEPWLSPSKFFAFGFYPEGSGFMVGIWLVGDSGTTITWTANRGDPPAPHNATIELTSDGKLVLYTDRATRKPIADTSDSAKYAEMNDSGNFLLYNKDSGIIWDSFSHPTDTILGTQTLPQREELISSVSDRNHSMGRFALSMQSDGNLVLYPVDSLYEDFDAYWSSDTYGHPGLSLYLDSNGILALVNRSNSIKMTLWDGNMGISSSPTSSFGSSKGSVLYRATLSYDGGFRVFSHVFDGKGNCQTSLEWTTSYDKCSVKGFCGFNSYCNEENNQAICTCFPGTDFVDRNAETPWCAKNFTEKFCVSGKSSASSANIVPMEKLTWVDLPYFKARMDREECIKSCLEDCYCDVAHLDLEGYCTKQKLPLKYARVDLTNTSSISFFKVGRQGFDQSNPASRGIKDNSKESTTAILAVVLGLVTYSSLCIILGGLSIFKLRVLEYRKRLESGNTGLVEAFILRSFSYKELKRATNGFKEKLGRGSFGTVYKGKLDGGKKIIAVKRLEKLVTEGEREFRVEMKVIGTTHHKNLVRLLGYCAEESKRLLVYEFMSNGSLADILFRSDRCPDWTERVRIALDIARGILYLHEECESPIIHCDIKPHNILMDEFWTAKISDFGLAKLLMPDQTRTFTTARGTRGYLAPEWNQNIPISVKVDVYSFGVVLLEIVCCRRNMDLDTLRSEEILLIPWVYKSFIAREVDKLVRCQDGVDRSSLERLVKVALWCVQEEAARRPSMKSVVMMLEGVTEISIPPCPTASVNGTCSSVEE